MPLQTISTRRILLKLLPTKAYLRYNKLGVHVTDIR